VVAEYRRGRTTTSVRAGRSLDITNDFRNPYDSGSTTGPLFGRDEYDYVDRRSAALYVSRFLGLRERAQLRVEYGFVRDRHVAANLTQSPLGFGRDFRLNRPATDGDYQRSAMTLEWRPDVSLEFLRTGVGARLYYERGDGGLSYQRIEGRFAARTNRGPLAFGARLDLGMTNPSVPPQHLFELGRNQSLLAYDYKEFAGDRAAVLRGHVLLRFPIFGAPIRLTQRLWLPPAAPALAFAAQAGWAEASNATALNTVTALGSTTTGHVRSSASLTLRFFGGAVGVGAARPLDYPGAWRWVFELGQRF